MKSLTKPTPELLDKALTSIPRAEQLSYFFSRLRNPFWIEPLQDRGYFKSPPTPDWHNEQGTVSFPTWPLSQYLSRMASERPEAVLAVIEKIPQTENFRIHEDFLKATVAMPPVLAASLTSQAIEWLHLPYGSHLADVLTKLIGHLAASGTTAEALKLIAALLEAQPDPERDQKRLERDKGAGGTSLQPRLRCPWWQLQRFFKDTLPLVVQAAPRETVGVLAAALDRVIDHSTFTDPPVDLSVVWRPAIEPHAQNWGNDFKTALVSALRDASEQAVRANPAILPILEATLRTHRWHLFERMVLHLCRKFPEACGPRIAKLLTNSNFFENPYFYHEYRLLLQEQFGNLDPQDQEIILVWIKQGPDLSHMVEDHSLSPVKKGEYANAWRLGWFYPIREALSPEWQDYYIALSTELGEPEKSDTVVWTLDSSDRKESPKTLDELRALSTGEIVHFMKTWIPGTGFFDPNPNGLAREFQNLVIERSETVSAEAELFQDVEPVYVRILLSGLSEAAKKGQPLQWQPLLRLANWILQQPVEYSAKQPDFHGNERRDSDWQPTRRELPRLLRDGFRESAAGLKIEDRREAWGVLQILLNDPDPTAEEEQEFSLDLATMCINTVRGEAMHALVDYGLWLRRNLLPHGMSAPDFDAMPEVQQALDEHLDPECEPSQAIRKVYGQYLPWLHLLDPKWVAENVRRILPDDTSSDRWLAGWSSYVVFNFSYDDLLPLVDPDYRRAIRQLGSSIDTKESFGKVDESLADHLMGFYWRGTINLHDTEGLLTEFYAIASDDLRAHAITGIGHALSTPPASVSEQQLARLMELWEWRYRQAVESSHHELFQKEIAAFAWWFSSGKFPEDWALQNMTRALEFSDDTEFEPFISERLASLAPQYPIGALTVLRQLVKRLDRTRIWLISGSETATILHQSTLEGNPKALALAREIRDLLLSFGYFEVRDVVLGLENDKD